MIAPSCTVLATLIACLLSLPGKMQAQPIDLTRSTIHCITPDPQFLLRTPEILQQEVEDRTGLRWPVTKQESPGPSIILIRLEDTASLSLHLRRSLTALPTPGSEGYSILTTGNGQTPTTGNGQTPTTGNGHILTGDKVQILIAAKDARGLLYGVGRLLRKLEMRRSSITLGNPLNISSTPVSKIRGHQLGYRPKTNSYDAFTVARFDHYIRDLALFGANSIEILPPHTDDDPTSPHMVLPPAKMIVEQSRICKSYGLDVWIWYPNVGKDYEHEDAVRQELQEREAVFSSLPKLDNVFVPAGDPGDLEPGPLFRWLEKEAVLLQKYHPHAKIWVSPQVFKPSPEWFTSFFAEVNKKYPWFGGVVFGPWVKIPIQQLRGLIDPSIPIRHYPDITHSLNCQYPIPQWDLTWAITLGRECINPRPYDEKTIHNTIAPYCIGSISYSEGTNDDVNKFVWSDQDWNPSTPVIETLRDYARLFMGPDLTEPAAQAIIGLEDNLKGPAATNTSIESTLHQWRRMEQQAQVSLQSPDTRRQAIALLQNPRFQMCLIRAYFDAYTRRRLLRESELEQQARDLLEPPTENAVGQATALLKSIPASAPAPEYKEKCLALADSLYKSIGAQLTITRHGGRQERGNFIDFIDYPLTDAPWLLDQLTHIKDSAAGLTAPIRAGSTARPLAVLTASIHDILHRTDPGPGGIYDHLADPLSFRRISPGLPWAQDPGNLQSPHIGFGAGLDGVHWLDNPTHPDFTGTVIPKAWMIQAMSLYDSPLVANYDDLDSSTDYIIKVTYTGRFRSHIKLTTGNGYLIHDYLPTGKEPTFESNLPGKVIHNGKITFVWQCMKGERGTQVTELWLIRKGPHRDK